jgi:hypothetical protein
LIAGLARLGFALTPDQERVWTQRARQIENQDAALATTRAQLAAGEHEIAQLKRRGARKDAALASAHAQLAAREHEIKQLKEVARKDVPLASALAQLAAREQEVKQLRKRVARKDAALATAHVQLAAFRASSKSVCRVSISPHSLPRAQLSHMFKDEISGQKVQIKSSEGGGERRRSGAQKVGRTLRWEVNSSLVTLCTKRLVG